MGPLIFKRFVCLVILIGSIFSCTSSEKQDAKFVLNDTIYASFPSHLNRDSFSVKIYRDEFIYWLNDDNNSITRISFEDEPAKILQFENSGPEAVGNVIGFTIVDPENIYLSVSAPNFIYLINSNGEVKLN